jgi:hypothetical protein
MTTLTFNPTTLDQNVNWDDSAIWSPGVVPNGADVDAVIPAVYLGQTPYPYFIGVGDVSIRSLDLRANYLLVAGALNVSGDLNEQGSAEIDLSGSVSAGSFELGGYGLQGHGSVNVAGALTVDGSIISSSGGGLTIDAASLTMTNTGWLQAISGNITLDSGGFTNLTAGVLTGGKYLASSHVLQVNDGQVVTVDAASIDLENGGDIELFDAATQQYVPIQNTLQTIATGGALEIGANVSTRFGALQDNGVILLNGVSNFTPASLTIGSGGVLEGNGTLNTTIVNDGLIDADVTTGVSGIQQGANLVVNAPVTGQGYFEIDGAQITAFRTPSFTGGTIEFTGPQSENVVFANGVGTLKLDAPKSFSGDIVAPAFLSANSVRGTTYSAFTLALQGIAYGSVTGYSYRGDAHGGVLAIDTTSGDYSFNFVGDLQTADFTISAAPQTLSTLPPILDVTVDPPAANACYRAGTRIASARGDIEIENLRVGDLALTHSGALRPIRWIGRRVLDIARHPAPRDVWPVRIRAGAFGHGLPRRDLFVSPGHNIAIDGVLMPAILLANGATVRQVACDRVDYFHVELDAHDIILAEGLPAESFLDRGNRSAFANGGAFVELHPDFAQNSEGETCLPIRKSGPELAAAKTHLLARAKTLGFATTPDPDLHLLVDGARIEPERIEGRRHHFALAAGAKDIRLVSRVWTPGHMRPDSADDRRLGVLVVGLACDGARLPLASLAGGWLDGGDDWRWTDGCAALDAGVRRITVDLDGDPLYLEAPSSETVLFGFASQFA